MDKVTIDKLNGDYESASKSLDNILKQKNLNSETIKAILGLSNRQIISDFLEKYNSFSEEDLEIIEHFIVNSLEHTDRLYVSNLIEFANEFELRLPYDYTIQLLKKYEGDDTYVQLAAITYLFENLKWNYVPKLYQPLKEILQNPNCNQRVQLLAAFALLRITGDQKYLSDIIDLVLNGQGNLEFFNNLLGLEYNDQRYFPYAAMLKPLISNSEKMLNPKSIPPELGQDSSSN